MSGYSLQQDHHKITWYDTNMIAGLPLLRRRENEWLQPSPLTQIVLEVFWTLFSCPEDLRIIISRHLICSHCHQLSHKSTKTSNNDEKDKSINSYI